MPTDEQQKQFEAWAEGHFPVEPTYWGHEQSRQHAGYVDLETRGAWAAWQARDAEVRRLVAALTSMVVEFGPNSENEIVAHQNAVMLLAEYLPEKEVVDAD